jgi:hypothetical protein
MGCLGGLGKLFLYVAVALVGGLVVLWIVSLFAN